MKVETLQKKKKIAIETQWDFKLTEFYKNPISSHIKIKGDKNYAKFIKLYQDDLLKQEILCFDEKGECYLHDESCHIKINDAKNT